LQFSENALYILKERYLSKHSGTQETVGEFIDRVSMGNQEYKDELIAPLNFLPNSPTLFNMDVPGGGTLSACFKFDVSDTMLDGFDGIMDTATKAALVTKWGGGTGYYVGAIRPKGALVNSTHGSAMGPVAVLRFYNGIGKMMTQGGKREAAQMGILDCDHPDIREFIHMKDTDPQALSTFNISVSISDSFMGRAVHRDTREHSILWEMAEAAWRTGDPGVYFGDRAEADNPTRFLGRLTGTNPCGEVPLLNNEACNLGSINLRNMYADGINWELLHRTATLATRYLDDVLERNHFPVESVGVATNFTRKLGLGVCGWADLLALMRIPYASDEAVNLLEAVIAFIRKAADEESLRLGEERGPAPCFAGTEIRFRNATRCCIAPTGTIAILMGASSGIEPHYLRGWTRTLGDGTVLSEHIGVLNDTDYVPQTAMEIPWEWHVKHQAAAQRHTDLAVSKTINMPNSATVEDIYNAYVYMWTLGCKGGTVYRDGCRETQVLNAVDEILVECPNCGAGIKHVEGCATCAAECGWGLCST
jgi:ribonucleoside-diphosphate reductase alpha chain